MKIVYFKDRLHQVGGMERILTVKANYLAERGYEVFIVDIEDGTQKPYYDLNKKIKVIYFNLKLSEVNHLYHRFDIFRRRKYLNKKKREYLEKTQNLLDDLNPDVAISMFGLEYYFWDKINFKGRSILELHFSREGVIKNSTYKINAFLYRKQLRYIYNKYRYKATFFTHVIHLTRQDKNDWGNLSNAQVIPNSLVFPIDHKRVNDYTLKNVISVGRMSKGKGFDLLITVWKKIINKYPDWSLTILGGGDKTPYVNLKNELKISDKNLKILDSTSQVEDYYYDSSIYVGTSLYEGFGLVITEAMACGLPVVFFDCPCGPAEIISDNEDGLLVDYLNFDDLESKIIKLIEDEKLRETMGKKGKENVKRFEMKTVMDMWENLFSS